MYFFEINQLVKYLLTTYCALLLGLEQFINHAPCPPVRWSDRKNELPDAVELVLESSQSPGLTLRPLPLLRTNEQGTSPTSTQPVLLHNLFHGFKTKLILEIDFRFYKRVTNMIKELTNEERMIYLVNWKATQKNIWISKLNQCP